ncbi:type I polyketide synthase [Chondromyces apiculatus]|uniref:Malonyl CoA-acyl carrier protein transacylase n=1 Tax=Chondromyces apiculatus DSM 436 TaxID=1192034 RepID=A0A017T9H6_9BACT|nr:type I polyketide synthase [Chondromyces apiculatus]EYF05470.1 Malonyl CoA-acyl carrier protein transacylase [Chondromyces apiculatus DSM 436]
MSNPTERGEDVSRLKRALAALEKMQQKLQTLERAASEPIAVIGIGCRFPGASGPDALWRLLREGRSAITEVPRDRWDIDALYDPDPEIPGKMYTRHGGFLDGVDGFDARFFGISPREAISMDPQQRLLLEVAWEALEDAGQPPDALQGHQTGVYIGFFSFDYYNLHVKLGDEVINAYTGTGNTASVAAGRLSYVLGLQGPSIAIDSACSSSLVAVHLACQSLRAGECNLALAGGVNLILTPDRTVYFCKLRAMAPDGRCKAFDASADGYVRGEGAGIVVLKRLSDALRDGDPILALVRGSAVNQDGRSNGLTAPNRIAQQAVIDAALARAGVAPSDIDYVEAHGSGTPLGDPIEATALGTALGRGRPADRPLHVGSIKSNMGHLEAAAGIAGFIKTVLALRHGEIPAHLHFREPNPLIPWSELPLAIPTETRPWPQREGARFAGINSFGFSGTNAHVILESPPPEGSRRPVSPAASLDASAAAPPLALLPLSARSPEALRALADAYRAHLHRAPTASLDDLCATAAVRRAHHAHRLAIPAGSRAQALGALDAFLRGDAAPGLAHGHHVPGERPRLVFAFPGQGGQWPGMAQQLHRTEPAFRAALEACEQAIHRHAGWFLTEHLHTPEDPAQRASIDRVQPTLFAIGVALAALWRSWGIEPDAVIGHSMGEIAAAHVAGALDLDDAARIVCRRSHLLRRVGGQGAMAIVELPLDEARSVVTAYPDQLSVAVSTSPRQTVLSGAPAALREVLANLGARGIFCRPIQVDVASHSPQMDPLRDALLQALSGIAPRPTAIPFHSTVTGAPIEGEHLDAAYWVQNLREPVLLWPTLERLLQSGHDTIIELGPHPILLPAVHDALQHLGIEGTTLASMRRQEDEPEAMRRALGALYACGHPVPWERLHPVRPVVSLPAYPWQRQRYWIDTDDAPGPPRAPQAQRPHLHAGAHDLLGRRLRSPLVEVQFETTFRRDAPAFLDDHRLHGLIVAPGASHLVMAMTAATEAGLCRTPRLEDAFFPRALVLGDDEERVVQVLLTPDTTGLSFRVFSASAPSDDAHGAHGAHGTDASAALPESWTQHAEGRVSERLPAAAPGGASDRVSLDEIRARCSETLPSSDFYRAMEARGYHFGPSFRTVGDAYRRDGEALCQVQLPSPPPTSRAARDVTLVDICLQFPAAVFPQGHFDTTYVPVGFKSFWCDAPAPTVLWCHARLAPSNDPASDILAVDVRLLDDSGTPVAELLDLRARRAGAEVFTRAAARPAHDEAYALTWEPLPAATAPRQTFPTDWLVIADHHGLGMALARRLEERSAPGQCLLVTASSTFHLPADPTPDDPVHLDPTDPDHLRRLLTSLPPRPASRSLGVVYLRALDALSPAPGGASPADACDAVVTGALRLAQALLGAGTEGAQLWLVTRGAQQPGDAPQRLAFEQASLWGLGRSLDVEHPELHTTLLDLDPAAPPADQAAQLHDALRTSDRERQLVLRAGRCLVARLTRTSLTPSADTKPPRLDPDATYLITGGLGGIGLELSRWMVRHGARHLLLVGRTPPRPEAAQLLDSLRAEGVAIVVATADVASRDQLAAALAPVLPPARAAARVAAPELAPSPDLDPARRPMPPLAGIVHAAAILDDGTFQNLDRARLLAPFAPKLDGAWNLHLLTRHLPLHFFVLFSSTAALLGAPGQANYAAASAALDALAHHRRALGLPALSIAWGPWSDVGLAAASSTRGERLSSRGIGSLTPDEGLTAFGRLLRASHQTLGVLHLDLAEWRTFYPGAADAAFMDRLTPLAPVATAPRTASFRASFRASLLAEKPGPARRAHLETHLRQHMARILRLAPHDLDPRQPLNTYGVDSLMALEARNTLERTLDLRLSATLLWTYPTLVALTDHLAERMEVPLEASPEPEAPPRPEAPPDSDLDDLSEDEMAALLSAELASLKGDA